MVQMKRMIWSQGRGRADVAHLAKWSGFSQMEWRKAKGIIFELVFTMNIFSANGQGKLHKRHRFVTWYLLYTDNSEILLYLHFAEF